MRGKILPRSRGPRTSSDTAPAPVHQRDPASRQHLVQQHPASFSQRLSH
ncbi:hypothetical protein [Streptomyces sp. CBMA156]|nr:hypothetical protein [Streptomyces sp. CBMA156]